jgi:hypothetical protein
MVIFANFRVPRSVANNKPLRSSVAAKATRLHRVVHFPESQGQPMVEMRKDLSKAFLVWMDSSTFPPFALRNSKLYYAVK